MVSQTEKSVGLAVHSKAASPCEGDAHGLASLPYTQFVWGAGIECSFLPHLAIDQFAWSQHDRFWREDLNLARNDLGITHLRYAFPWHLLEPQPGRFDWSYSDQRIEETQKLGLNLLLDVMHFGTPLWLPQAVGDPEFPEALERFTSALVSRYRSVIQTWCPFNEPMVCALFSGDFGFWPPHARKWRGYMPVLSRIVQATSRAIRAIRSVMPEAIVLLCDGAENYKSADPALETEVRRRNLRKHVVMDLLTGRVDARHPLYPWLTAYGISELDIEWFRTHPQQPDVLGLDYYPHTDWELELIDGRVRQRRTESPVGLYGVGCEYYHRYGIPIMLTESSVEGKPVNREIWLETLVDDCKRLRAESIPMLGMIWWPMIDQVDWDGAMTHRIGKLHQVGLYSLVRQSDGILKRTPTPLAKLFKEMVAGGDEQVGELSSLIHPSFEAEAEQLPPIGQWIQPTPSHATAEPPPDHTLRRNGNGHPTGTVEEIANSRLADPAPGIGAEPTSSGTKIQASTPASASTISVDKTKHTDRYGIVVFSHLRWGFVWQRPQQFLSRFARKHTILFVEEPMFDLAEGREPRIDYHRVMPNVTVITPHCPATWNQNPKLPDMLVEWTRQGIQRMNTQGQFDAPLLWYYSPMDSAWSLGKFPNRGIVYDSMDELSQFTGAPKQLVSNEDRLMRYADIVLAGGYELWLKKKQKHHNVHFFGCGVEYDHFAKAQDPNTAFPPDIDFMARPILGWFGVVDERVDYALVGEMARLRPDWSFALVGPVVKVDPNLLPHSPNLFWMGSRDYQVLPNYCAAFDICMMPFAMNASTQYINPTKVLEYMATGRPIISTPVRDVVRQYADLVDIVQTPKDFLATADRLLHHPDPQRICRGIEKAQQSSWDTTVKTIQSLIRDAITDSDRPSKQQIPPLTQAELEYQYHPTPGS